MSYVQKISLIALLIFSSSFSINCGNKDPALIQSESSHMTHITKDGLRKDKNSNQSTDLKYSFTPTANLSLITKEDKKSFQKIVNTLGEIEKNKLELAGFDKPYYWDNMFYIPVVIRNGYDFDIYDISSRVYFKVNNEVIGKGSFKFSCEEFGVLQSNMSRVYTLAFPLPNLKEIIEFKDIEDLTYEIVHESDFHKSIDEK